jgi:hypothetical protein
MPLGRERSPGKFSRNRRKLDILGPWSLDLLPIPLAFFQKLIDILHTNTLEVR